MRTMSWKQRVSLFWHRSVRPAARRAAVAVLRRLPISSRNGGIPNGVIPDAAEWIRETERRHPSPDGKPRHWQVKVRDAEEVDNPPPRSVESPIPEVFRSYMHHSFPELSVTCIRGGRVATADGTVISPDDRVFEQFIHTWGD